MNFNINIYSIVILVLSALVGFLSGPIAKKIYKDDEDRITKTKIIMKSVSLVGIIAALLISIYL